MKKFLLLCILSAMCNALFAQATDLVIDCQTPGWLSSKINYGDQQSVKNLKVTGYINKTDLNFIGSLTQLSLNGIIDLGEVNIVGNSWNGSFKILSTSWGTDYTYHLQKLILPATLSDYEEHEGTRATEVDTLVFDTSIKVIKGYDSAHRNYRTDTKQTFERKIGHLIIGESTDSIINIGRAKSVHFPHSLRYLENYSCSGRTDYSKWNISDFPNLEYLGYCVFTYNVPGTGQTSFSNNQTLPDSIFLPKIKTFCMSSFDYKEGMHIFMGDQLMYLTDNDGISWTYPYQSTIRNVSFHMKRIPVFGWFTGCDSSVKIYVPKGTKQDWINARGTTYTIIEEAQPLEKIEISLHEVSLEINGTISLTASPVPANADDVNIIWNSDEPEVCTVNEEGLVKAIRPGVSNIIAMSSDGLICDTCQVTVIAHAESISLSTNSVVLSNIGDSKKIEVTILPENAVDKSVTWKSSNEQVCSVSQEGVIVATGAGSTIVTATTVDGGHTANCVVKVLQHVTGLGLEKKSISLKVGENESLKAEVKPDNADDKAVKWSSSNEQIATVDTIGNVKALKAGEAWIKAVSVDNAEAKDSCKVTVTQPVTGITISQESIRLTNIGENKQLEATVLPEDASNKEVKWKSSNESICMVANGKVIATGFGTSVVMVTTVDGGFMASCTVTVESENTSIESVDVSVSDNPVYNMMGRKVTVLEKGRLYIRNGKKFIAK